MKKIFSILLFVFLFSTAISQSLKTIKIKTPSPAKTKEIFQVLKSNPTIKNGKYKKYKYKTLIEKGFFKNNEKDSVWCVYSQNEKLVATGKYKSDKKVGVWNFYAKDETLVQKYDYDNDSLIYLQRTEENTSNFPDTAQQKLPLFIGGIDYMNALLENNIVYPKVAWNKNETAKVYVSFIVDTLGNTTDVKSIKHIIGDGFDEAAVEAVKSLGKSWIPGSQKGKKVRVQYSLPLDFN